MSKHTPGPWTYQEQSDVYTHIVRGPNNHFLAQLSQDPTGTSEANARLMAAAPDFYAASREALSAMENIWNTRDKDDDWIYDEMGSELASGYFSLRAAIAKATQP